MGARAYLVSTPAHAAVALHGFGVHNTSYQGVAGQRFGRALADQVLRRTVFAPRDDVTVRGWVGEPVEVQLTARSYVPVPLRAERRWRVAPGARLPAGLTLTPRGLLSGTPLAPVSGSLTVEVSGLDPQVRTPVVVDVEIATRQAEPPPPPPGVGTATPLRNNVWVECDTVDSCLGLDDLTGQMAFFDGSSWSDAGVLPGPWSPVDFDCSGPDCLIITANTIWSVSINDRSSPVPVPLPDADLGLNSVSCTDQGCRRRRQHQPGAHALRGVGRSHVDGC